MSETPLLNKLLGQTVPPLSCFGGLPKESERPAEIIRENAKVWGAMTTDSLYKELEQAVRDSHYSLTQEGADAAEEAISYRCAIQYYHATRMHPEDQEGAGIEHHNSQEQRP